MSSVSEAQKKARNKWDKENMAVIACKVTKAKAEKFKEYAAKKNTNPNALIREYIDECLENNNDVPTS